MDDFETRKLRYTAAFDAYLTIVRQNSTRAVSEDPPSVDDWIVERQALEVVKAARDELLATLGRAQRGVPETHCD
jgi:hypothetical protein